MSVEVKTPTKAAEFERVTMHHSFSSPENLPMRRSKDDACIRNESRFSQPWGRKRRYSQSYRKEEGAQRRKRLKSTPCAGPLPNRFLNGGSIDDPLNLNGLDSSELGRQLNSVTPQSSPLPRPSRRESVEVRFPVNVTDPLNLNDSSEEADLEKSLKRKQKRNRHKKKDDISIFSPPKHISRDKSLLEALKIDIEPEPMTSDVSKQKDAQQKARQVCNKIVSPVIPQISPKNKKRRRTNSGCKPEPSQAVSRSLHSFSSGNQSGKHQDKRSSHSPKKFKHPKPPMKKVDSKPVQGCKKQPKFIYGNYNRYYGYRNPSLEEDKRLKCFKREWFEGKSVLDIGCNVGQLTLSVAHSFEPTKIVGIDIDPKLIMAARKNIRYYMSAETTDTSKFPISNILSYGPIVAPPISQSSSKPPVFPQNVLFRQGNYVLECDELLELQKEEYDVILALSVTKWIHFNWGDDGLRRFFKRVYRQLRPGGKFILEPQPWSSYKKKKKLTDEIHANFKKIRLKPEQFTDYLLSREVGFSTCNTLDVPYNASKGFRRAVLMFTKTDTIQNSPWSEVGDATPVPWLDTPATSTPTAAMSVYSEDSSSSSDSDSSSSSNSSCTSNCSPSRDGKTAINTPSEMPRDSSSYTNSPDNKINSSTDIIYSKTSDKTSDVEVFKEEAERMEESDNIVSTSYSLHGCNTAGIVQNDDHENTSDVPDNCSVRNNEELQTNCISADVKDVVVQAEEEGSQGFQESQGDIEEIADEDISQEEVKTNEQKLDVDEVKTVQDPSDE